MLRTAVLAIALVGCGERLAPQSEVTKLRVLGLRADLPEASPGDTVNVDALWADPEGGGRDVGFVWLTCAMGPGADPRSCLAAGGGFELQRFSGVGAGHAYGAIEIPEDALDSGDEAIVLVTLVVCAGGLPDLVAAADTGEIVCPEEESVVAYKRIDVTHGESPNRNPGIAEVQYSESTWADNGLPPAPACPTGDCPGYLLSLFPEPEAAEVYLEETPDGEAEATEELLVSFFATGGEFDRIRAIDEENSRFDVAWRPPKEPGDVTVWFVLRDGRGGIDWAERTIRVTP